jgi:3-oxoadipate enol-lactonase
VPTLTLDGTDLYFERRGTGEPLLLIQGLGGNSLHWGEGFLGALEEDFELILYDHRGAGRSGALTGACTIARLADDALALLDALGLAAAHVVGISMGGMVAQELALRAPERVRTLTLGCTFPGGPEAIATAREVTR